MKCTKCGQEFEKPQLWFAQDVPEFSANVKFNVVSKVESQAPPDARLCLACSGEVVLMAASALHMHLQNLHAKQLQLKARQRPSSPPRPQGP